MKKLLNKHKWFILLLQAIAVLLFFTVSGCIPVIPESSSSAQQPSDDGETQTPLTPQPENRSPVIIAIAAPVVVPLSESVEISCIARDEDGDILFYTWSADKGAFRGSGKNILWIAPDVPGDCVITSTVTDGKGSEVKRNITVNVAVMSKVNRAPLIRSIMVTPRGKPSVDVILTGRPVAVRRWDVIDIECNAVDPDGEKINFVWSATAGKLSGEGARIEYIATEGKDQVVTVIITDSANYSTSGEIHLDISCCGG